MSKRKEKFTPGKWGVCFHLESESNDKSCPCGQRGTIWGGDEQAVICQMGIEAIHGEEGLSLDRYPREQEIANAHLIAAAPEMYELLATIENDAGTVPDWLWKRIKECLAKSHGESR